MCDCQCKGNAPVTLLKGELVIDAATIKAQIEQHRRLAALRQV